MSILSNIVEAQQAEIDRLNGELDEIRAAVSKKLDGGPVLPKVQAMAKVVDAAMAQYNLDHRGPCMLYQIADAEQDLHLACQEFSS